MNHLSRRVFQCPWLTFVVLFRVLSKQMVVLRQLLSCECLDEKRETKDSCERLPVYFKDKVQFDTQLFGSWFESFFTFKISQLYFLHLLFIAVKPKRKRKRSPSVHPQKNQSETSLTFISISLHQNNQLNRKVMKQAINVSVFDTFINYINLPDLGWKKRWALRY